MFVGGLRSKSPLYRRKGRDVRMGHPASSCFLELSSASKSKSPPSFRQVRKEEWGTPDLWAKTAGLSAAFGGRLTSLEMTGFLLAGTGRGPLGSGGGISLIKYRDKGVTFPTCQFLCHRCGP